MTKGARSSAVVALLVIVAGLAIAACGSSNASSSASASSAAATSTSATGTSTTTGGRGGFAALTATQRSCLKSKGVTLPTGGGFRPGSGTGTFTRPTGTPPGGGTSTTGGGYGGGGFGGFGGAGGPGGAGGGGFRGGANSKFAAAFKACGVTFGAGRFGAGGFARRAGGAVSSAALKKFVSCVNAHGYKLTGVNTSGTGAALPKSLQTNKKFLAAARSCTQDLRPSGAGAGGAPGGTAPTTTASSS